MVNSQLVLNVVALSLSLWSMVTRIPFKWVIPGDHGSPIHVTQVALQLPHATEGWEFRVEVLR